MVKQNSFITDKPLHFGTGHAGQTYDWLPSDTEEVFQKLMQDPDYRQYAESQNWHRPGAISYRINSEGFRGAEFDQGPFLLTLGCSFTIGIGLAEQDIWPTLVANALGMKSANIAWGGIAADTCIRLAAYWIPKLQPAAVIMLTPPRDRYEIFLDEQYAKQNMMSIYPVEVMMPQSQVSVFSKDEHCKHWWLNDNNSLFNRYRNEMTLRQICAENSAPCLIYDSLWAFGRSREEVGFARDYLHAGAQGHQMLADRIISDWNEIKHS